MLELTQAQWRILQAHDKNQFVDAVCKEFLGNRNDMLETPGRAQVRHRMHAAYSYAERTGFTSTPHIVRLMYLAADAPGIHDDPIVDTYLRKAPATLEQRLDDLVVVINRKLEGR